MSEEEEKEQQLAEAQLGRASALVSSVGLRDTIRLVASGFVFLLGLGLLCGVVGWSVLTFYCPPDYFFKLENAVAVAFLASKAISALAILTTAYALLKLGAVLSTPLALLREEKDDEKQGGSIQGMLVKQMLK